MRSPNILRQSGGADIKLKNKVRGTASTILLVLAGMGGCLLIYYFFDNILNGAFVDWFESNFMYMDYGIREDSGTEYFTWRIRWYDLKEFIFGVFLVIVMICILIVRIVTGISSRNAKKRMITDVSRMFYEYMHNDREATEVFPMEYAELSLQAAEMKSTMQRHEQILKEEASRKNDLITYLAHDLKTPLTSVIGYLSLLQEAPDMPPEQKAKYVNITLDKALRLEKLINEFFEITRYNLQQIVIERETVDLSYMLVQMTDEFYPILNDHGNTVELQVEDNIVIHADAAKLARVFNNILKNAIAYSYPDTPIWVMAQMEEDKVCISFQNQGKTIPRQKLDSIFEKFFRLDEARTTNTGGAGLGLAIAREIVTLHGGTILAESEDEVTTFIVTLPL